MASLSPSTTSNLGATQSLTWLLWPIDVWSLQSLPATHSQSFTHSFLALRCSVSQWKTHLSPKVPWVKSQKTGYHRWQHLSWVTSWWDGSHPNLWLKSHFCTPRTLLSRRQAAQPYWVEMVILASKLTLIARMWPLQSSQVLASKSTKGLCTNLMWWNLRSIASSQ